MKTCSAFSKSPINVLSYFHIKIFSYFFKKIKNMYRFKIIYDICPTSLWFTVYCFPVATVIKYSLISFSFAEKA